LSEVSPIKNAVVLYWSTVVFFTKSLCTVVVRCCRPHWTPYCTWQYHLERRSVAVK